MEIIRAEHSGFCFGVRRALEKTIDQIEHNTDGRRIFTCGPLIHNTAVTDDLASRGVGIISDLHEASAGDIVIVRSHGESEEFFVRAEAQGLDLVDATCPFVTRIHKLVRQAKDQGRHVIIVGDKNHPEVIGINGWCDNEASIIGNKTEAEAFAGQEAFVVCQTTLNEETLSEVTKVLIDHGVEITVNYTICSAT
ncbi:MAG: bifunctional 4-hydroxy-3-methylbut-2-enyl diphosphate reductase/30S ribosomal protein S1, partial [Clostridiales bacterium]|nr:bifunctional 4-hydroxy-3-methylbut-2-enyl diphosphate reductase/30S ribosomal protein S1 [Clostridiales bacterium]